MKPKIAETVERALRELRLRGAVLVPHEGAPTLLGKPVLRAISPLHPEVPLYLRPDGFAQANAEGNVALVTSALYELGPREGDRVLELYSGNGNFTFALAAIAREVVAVESSKIGVGLAQRSVQEARLANVKLVEGDSRKVAEGLAKEGAAVRSAPRRSAAHRRAGIAQWASRLGRPPGGLRRLRSRVARPRRRRRSRPPATPRGRCRSSTSSRRPATSRR